MSDQNAYRLLMDEVVRQNTTVEDIARAWASVDGKRDEFDACKIDKTKENEHGYYQGYLCDAEEMLTRAATYAWHRRVTSGQPASE